MKRWVALVWVMLASGSSVACGGNDEDVYCCALGKIAAQCAGQTGVSTLKEIADSENAEACKFTLEQNELDCDRTPTLQTSSYYHEDDAIAECAAE